MTRNQTLFLLLLAGAGLVAYLLLGGGTLLTTGTSGGDQASATTARQDQTSPLTALHPALREEAGKYIKDITRISKQPLSASEADDFVTRDQLISLFQKLPFEEITLADLQADAELKPGSPITVVKEQEQIVMISPEELLSEVGGNLDEIVRVLENDIIRETTAGDLIDEYRTKPGQAIALIRKVEYLEITTLDELSQDQSLPPQASLRVIRRPYRLQTITVGELLTGAQEIANDAIFYVRNVTERDKRGIWGIVHDGLVRNFASGIAIRRGEMVRKYQVDIPPDADQRLEDQSSSYLGRMIDQKTHSTYIYNYEKGSMGRNPDLIYPGQELVIVGFSPEELISIYEHFVARSRS
jgi:hypothetical protein